jgi:uncharacterized protein YcbX
VTSQVGRVAWIAIAPVKSMGLMRLDSARLELTGIAGDRAFAVLDEEGRLCNGKRFGQLATIRPDHDPVAGTLGLRFPNGEAVEGEIRLGAIESGIFFGHLRAVRALDGPWSDALSNLAGRPLRLVAMADTGNGLDRGPTATLLSTAALGVLAAAGGASEPLDPRRFRMTFGIDGVDAYAEDDWIGRDVRIGNAVVRPAGNVGRCAVTTQDPDTGRPTFDTLGSLQATRGFLPTSEPLPFGVWADVIVPGDVALGDAVEPALVGGMRRAD